MMMSRRALLVALVVVVLAVVAAWYFMKKPKGQPLTVSGFNYANCDGLYTWTGKVDAKGNPVFEKDDRYLQLYPDGAVECSNPTDWGSNSWPALNYGVRKSGTVKMDIAPNDLLAVRSASAKAPPLVASS